MKTNCIYLLWVAQYAIFGCADEYDTKVLMVMLPGNGTDFKSLWNSSPGYNVGDGSKHELTLEEIILDGNFRNEIIDNWENSTPDTVTLVASNRYGDFLWFVTFDTSNTQKFLSSWLRPELIISGSDSLFPNGNVSIYFNYSTYDFLVATNDDLDIGWFAIENSGSMNTTAMEYPIFLYVNNVSHPMSFTKRNIESLVNYWYSTPGTMFLNTKLMVKNVEYIIYDSDKVIHINKIKGYVFLKRYNYTIAYSLDRCSWNKTKIYKDAEGKNKIFITEDLLSDGTDIDTIFLRCFIVNVSMYDTSNFVTFQGWGFTDNFLPADAIAIIGHYVEESPATTTTTTTATATTIKTTEAATTTDVATTSTTTTEMTSASIPSIVDQTSSVGNMATTTDVPNDVYSTNIDNSSYFLCSCACTDVSSSDMTVTELYIKIEKIKQKLILDPKNLSSHQRKLVSVNDQRPTARGLGYLGVTVLVLTLVVIIILDMNAFANVISSRKAS